MTFYPERSSTVHVVQCSVAAATGSVLVRAGVGGDLEMDWRKRQTIVFPLFPGPRHAVIVTKYSFSKLPCSWWCVNNSQCSHVQDHIDRVFLDQFHLLEGGGARRDKTGADFVTFFWSSLSVFLIGPHTPATLGCWPGSSVWTNQTKVVKKSFPNSSNISKQNSCCIRCSPLSLQRGGTPKKISVTAIGRGAKTITQFVYGP